MPLLQMEFRNCILRSIRMWSLFCLIWIYLSLNVLSDLSENKFDISFCLSFCLLSLGPVLRILCDRDTI